MTLGLKSRRRRIEIVRDVQAAINQSDLTAREQRRLSAAIRWRPRFRAEAYGLVLSECHAEEIADEDGLIEESLDREAFLEFLEQLLPILLRLLLL